MCPFLIPPTFDGVIAAHHFSFLYCVFCLLLFVLYIVFAMDYSYLILPVFDGTINVCYANIQTCLMLMTTFFCSHRRRFNTNSPHSHPFHQSCISEEWIQICFCTISEFLHIFWNQQSHQCMSGWNSLCHLTMKLLCVCCY